MPRKKSKQTSANRSDLIAAIALIISLGTLTWTIFKDVRADIENLKITQFNSSQNHTTDFGSSPFPNIPGFYSERVKLSISNTSNKDISILKVHAQYQSNQNILEYHELIDYSEIPLPINIPSNRAITLPVTVKYILARESYEVLSKKFESNSRPVFVEFLKTLYRSGIDQFGNKITEYREFGTGTDYMLSWPNKRQTPKIRIEFTTSKENRFGVSVEPR